VLTEKLAKKDSVIAEVTEAFVTLKNSWGPLRDRWVPHDTRDAVIDFIATWSQKTELPAGQFTRWLHLNPSKYFNWKTRYGKANEHHAQVPRDHWLESSEKQAIIDFAKLHPLDGYRRLTFMMLDQDLVAVSPSSTYRVFKQAGLLQQWNGGPTKKGTGFIQPIEPHEHWHIDISHLNICGTFYYLCSVLDGCSRFIVHRELWESMTKAQVELVLQKAKEKYPLARPRIISDNGPQFIAKDFKEFVRISGMSHVRTSPYYPQSNGKIERWHKSLKSEAIRPKPSRTVEQTRKVVTQFVEECKTQRSHSGIGYVTPQARIEGRHVKIWEDRDRKLETARVVRAVKRQQARQQAMVAS
jgi:putative transposase